MLRSHRLAYLLTLAFLAAWAPGVFADSWVDEALNSDPFPGPAVAPSASPQLADAQAAPVPSAADPAAAPAAAGEKPGATTEPATALPYVKGPPLPFHTIEGYGGGAITPIAYLVNPPAPGNIFGLPAGAFSYVNLGSKNLEAFTVTENIAGRVELGYGADHFDFGTLRSDIQSATGININHNDEWLHNFNVRVLALPEGSFNLPLPALTLGASLKYNDTISSVYNTLGGRGGPLYAIGYRRDWGADFTQTFTKAFPHVFGRPLILSAGLRESDAANLGFLGFTDTYKVGFEGNIVYLPTDWLLVAYEYRNKPRGFSADIPGLINQEQDWHAFDVSWLINKRATLVAGYGIFGNLANSKANSAWWLQVKYEF
jgi:hypothetical protein